ncbi:MAG TPA: hypothetical protein VFX30_10535 [bacterium]|nr:hypothetical protein [bacterium]
MVAFPFAAEAFDLTATGYNRARLVYYHDLDTQQPNPNVNQGGLGDNDRFGSILYFQERLRVEPIMKINDNISLQAQFDILDNIIAGTEETKNIDFLSPIVGTIQLPGAGGALGVTGGESGENKVLNVRRAYMDILTPGGKFRIGRQPSHFGLGIFQNDGNGFNDDFGDTFDRILYLASLETKKLGNFSFGAVVDFVFTKQQDPRISGLGAAITGPAEDTRQFAGLVVWDYHDLTLGAFSGIRYRNGKEGQTTSEARQILVDANGDPILDGSGNFQLTDPLPAGQDGDTLLYFTDLYGEYKHGPFRFRGEYVLMSGKISTGLAIDAIPFNNLPANARGPIEMPAQNDLLVQMAAAEFEAKYKFGTFLLQGGYSSGDSQPLSSRITQYGFRPDYQIALLMFHAPLGSSPRVTQANGNGAGSRQLVGAVPVTGNYINNAIYTTVGYAHNLDITSLVPAATSTKVGLKFITAWAPSNNFDIDFAEITGFTDLPHVVNSNKWYGWEADANFQSRFYDHFLFDLTAGFMMPGPAYDVEVAIFNPTNLAQVNAIPFDGANWVWGIRTNLIVDF